MNMRYKMKNVWIRMKNSICNYYLKNQLQVDKHKYTHIYKYYVKVLKNNFHY
jgi:hypothetical protein